MRNNINKYRIHRHHQDLTKVYNGSTLSKLANAASQLILRMLIKDDNGSLLPIQFGLLFKV